MLWILLTIGVSDTGPGIFNIEVKQYFICELKEKGILVVYWTPGLKNESDLFTKNLGGPKFISHTEQFCGKDDYYTNP